MALERKTIFVLPLQKKREDWEEYRTILLSLDALNHHVSAS